MMWNVAILSISDFVSKGEAEDTSAQVIRELIEEEMSGEVVDYRVVPQAMDEIMAALIEMSDYYKADLILTSGGIGLTPREVTPEATAKVVDRLAPGFSELIRARTDQSSFHPMFNRGISGIRGKTLIINLPGSPKSVHESLNVILPQLPLAMSAISSRGQEYSA
ncbi:molybdenum cofactor biosynthesis protein B [Marinicrinis lubricantis]|uniref:Molybdenum cofactor biosynthesis protein B n=1 Tax=Marinicrinis lubricantis TaxID=2086470 RepID=A0ABW1IRK8_9BACL